MAVASGLGFKRPHYPLEGFFLGLQTDYELMERRRKIGEQLKASRPRRHS